MNRGSVARALRYFLDQMEHKGGVATMALEDIKQELERMMEGCEQDADKAVRVVIVHSQINVCCSEVRFDGASEAQNHKQHNHKVTHD